MKTELPPKYFEAFGPPTDGSPFTLIDDFRFDMVYQQLTIGSVLDIGVYLGDFVKLLKNKHRIVYGTDINQERVDLVNKIIGENIAQIGFRNGSLINFDNDYVDNVVCMEVLEHVYDQKYAISEICRVARNRVVITVPYKEIIRHMLCIHCYNQTPFSGHLHSYDLITFYSLLPEKWGIIKMQPFAFGLTRALFSKTRNKVYLPVLKIIDRLAIGKARWLLVVLEGI